MKILLFLFFPFVCTQESVISTNNNKNESNDNNTYDVYEQSRINAFINFCKLISFNNNNNNNNK